MATPARNSRVLWERICGPLSEIANSSGSWPWPGELLDLVAVAGIAAQLATSLWRGCRRRPRAGPRRPGPRKATSTWIEDSSAQTRVVIHVTLRNRSRSRVTNDDPLAELIWFC
jgi:hypothetical protein